MPRKKELVKYLEDHGSVLFHKRWINKTDSFIGSRKALNFINKFLKKRNVEIEEFTRID